MSRSAWQKTNVDLPSVDSVLFAHPAVMLSHIIQQWKHRILLGSLQQRNTVGVASHSEM